MGSTDNFPVYLPSNTRNSLYENKTSNYRVQLAKPLEFPDGNWEVGLAEITYPYTWYDVPVPATIHVLTTLQIPSQKLLLSGTNITIMTMQRLKSHQVPMPLFHLPTGSHSKA
jgi:hypothetical protein